MDSSEKLVQQHLINQGFTDIVYEPDGNISPDFLVNGQIAIEVRRLNQNHFDGTTTRGLEEAAIPLWKRVTKLIASFGPPTADESWFVFFRFSRPVEEWRTLEPKIRAVLTTVGQDSAQQRGTLLALEGFDLMFSVQVRHIRLSFYWLVIAMPSQVVQFSPKWKQISRTVLPKNIRRPLGFAASTISGGLHWWITSDSGWTISIEHCFASKSPLRIVGTGL